MAIYKSDNNKPVSPFCGFTEPEKKDKFLMPFTDKAVAYTKSGNIDTESIDIADYLEYSGHSKKKKEEKKKGKKNHAKNKNHKKSDKKKRHESNIAASPKTIKKLPEAEQSTIAILLCTILNNEHRDMAEVCNRQLDMITRGMDIIDKLTDSSKYNHNYIKLSEANIREVNDENGIE